MFQQQQQIAMQHQQPQQQMSNYIQYPAQFMQPPMIKSPQEEQQQSSKSRSLERNVGQNLVSTYAARINSLERTRQMSLEYGAAKAMRSNSLTRQYSGGNQMDSYPVNHGARSASLERGGQINQGYINRMGSLERNQNQAIFLSNLKGGSLERNQSAAIVNDMMTNKLSYKGGSLERNQHIMMNAGSRGGSLERNMSYQNYRSPVSAAPREQEPFQEEIYDFGGVNVKSCASIALKKSVEKGILPPSTLMSPGGQPAANFSLPPPYSSAQSTKFSVQQQQQQQQQAHQQNTPQRALWQQQQMYQQQQQQPPPPPYSAVNQGQMSGVPMMGIASSQQVQLPHQTASAMKIGIAQSVVAQQIPMMATMPQQVSLPLQQANPNAPSAGAVSQQVCQLVLQCSVWFELNIELHFVVWFLYLFCHLQ